MFGKAVTNQPDNVSGHECDHHGSPVLDRARARCGDGGHARARAPRTPLAPPRARIGLGRTTVRAVLLLLLRLWESPPSSIRYGQHRACQELLNLGGAGEN